MLQGGAPANERKMKRAFGPSLDIENAPCRAGSYEQRSAKPPVQRASESPRRTLEFMLKESTVEGVPLLRAGLQQLARDDEGKTGEQTQESGASQIEVH
jgi:hypothetical protein